MGIPARTRERCLALGVLIALAVDRPGEATTLVKQELGDLVRESEVVVVGRVRSLQSYWNSQRTFILTDVAVDLDQTFKGEVSSSSLIVTLMGGAVGNLTTVIVCGPELIPGRSYLLFLRKGNLPGGKRAVTVGALCQGVFDIELTPSGLRAVSQAALHGVLSLDGTSSDPAGGKHGMEFDDMVVAVEEAVRIQASQGR
jgi:hypothetical protein